ncbi:MAG: fibrobacter succinogenes major paralogous domain-containing protein, partial [Bacteroidota bacterium]
MRIIAFTLGLVLGSGVAATAQPTDYPVMAQSADLPAVQIAGLWWMQENLSVTRYQNGDSIPDGTADHAAWAQLSTGAWAYPDSQAALRRSFGLLYNWYAVNDPRGLCPTGWRLPTHDEWTALTHALGGETKAGAVLKARQGWLPALAGRDEKDFRGLPAGFRGSDGTYGGLGAYAYWWSSTGSGINGAWGRFVDG